MGNVLTGLPEHVEAALEAGALENLIHLAKRGKSSLRKEIMWALSNVCADSPEAVERFLRSDAYVLTIELCNDPLKEVRKEAQFSMINALTTGEAVHVLEMLENPNLVPLLIEILKRNDEPKLAYHGLVALHRLFSLSNEALRENIEDPIETFKQVGGEVELQKLVVHANKEISDLAEKALKVLEEEEGRFEEDEERMVDAWGPKPS